MNITTAARLFSHANDPCSSSCKRHCPMTMDSKGASLNQVLSAAMASTTVTVAAGPETPHERSKYDVMCWHGAPDASCICLPARTRRPLYLRKSFPEVENPTSSSFLGFPMEWRRRRLNFGTPQVSERGERTATRVSGGGNH